MTLAAGLAIAAITFLAGLANGMTGFAFALIAGGTYFQFLPPGEAVPMILTLSLVAQLVHWLRQPGKFGGRQALPFIIGGVLGVPLGVMLSRHLDREVFRLLIGAFLIGYSLYLLLGRVARLDSGRFADGVVGVAAGIMGGLAGLSGALVTAWCALKSWDKDAQRAAYQPFIVFGQGFALVNYVWIAGYPHAVAVQSAIALPPLVAGMLVGYGLYRRFDDLLFRRVVLTLLLVAGVLLVV